MSDALPPLPPSGGMPPPPPPNLNPPMPPAPAAGGYPSAPPVYGATPGAYQGYPATGPMNVTAGVRKAAIVLFWATTAAMAVLGLVAYQRGTVADDVINGNVAFSDIDGANSRIGGAVLVVALLQISAAIVVAIWSNRTVANARTRGATDASSGLAAGGWFIPIAWYFIPFNELRKATKPFGTPPTAITTWQLLFIGQVVLSIAARSSVGNTVNLDDVDAVSALHRQGILFLVTAVILAVTTIFASKALKSVDALTTPA